MNLKQYTPFLGLLIFGNIENLVLACDGVVAAVNPVVLVCLSLCCVVAWFLLGTYGTKIAIKYADAISFIGGLAIFILGIQSMFKAVGIL